MKKAKGLVVIIGLVLAVLGVTVYLALSHNAESKSVFLQDGYILEADEEARTEKILVGGGDAYEKKTAIGVMEFEDAAGKERTLPADTFVHYQNGDIGATKGGVLLNLEDISGNLINHYTTTEDMVMQTSGNQFSVSYDGASKEFTECLWKISDTNYLLRSPEITIHFAEDDVRNSGNYLQVRYIDGGVVQMLTEENVWHSISPEVYAKTQSGTCFYLARQMVEKDGNKLFVSKLTESANVPVVLPDEETNNLAVPEISIQAVDGKNGEEGEHGADGTAGTDGAGGESGLDGEEGEEGEEGESGESGSSGAAGAAGAAGNKGNTGTSGDVGNTGYQGNKGGAGLGVEGDSSSKTALPVMTFSEWDVTDTEVRGTVMVEDERELLKEKTGTIQAVEVQDDSVWKSASWVQGGSEIGEEFDFASVSEEGFEFVLKGLKPDTEYKIMVSSEYVMEDNDGNPQTYRRDFIIRSFYTNSSGAYLEVLDAEEESLRFKIVKQNYSNASVATVYLLTKEQAEAGFSKNKTADYLSQAVSLDGDGDVVVTFNHENTGDKIKPNTEYFAYLLVGSVVEDNLIGRPVDIKTLKHPLEFDKDQKTSVTVNRQKGAFEVYRPKVTDIDGGLISYIFEAVDTQGKVVRTLEVAPSGSEIITFFADDIGLQRGEDYQFRVKARFDDNQKEVEYLISHLSDPVTAPEGAIPAIEWHPSESVPSAPADIAGNIVAHTANSNVAVPTPNTPITLHILADGIYEKEIVIKEETDVTLNETQLVIPVKADNLKENTTYRVAVYAYVDGEKTQLGYVTFATRKMTAFKAVWSPTGDTSHAISQNLYLKPVDALENDLEPNSQEMAYAEYDMKTIGQLKLTLYRGTGAGKTPIESITVNNTSGNDYDSSLAAEYFNPDKPVELNEGTFGMSSTDFNDALAYSLEVSAVYDYTVKSSEEEHNLSGYINESMVYDRTVPISKNMVPPQIPAPDTTDRAVKVQELYNKDAAKYGGTVNPNLTDDAIIGYRLKSGYDNSSSLAREITYYAYEALGYKKAERGGNNMVEQDARKEGETDENAAFQTTITISALSSVTPEVIFMFGEGSNTYYNDVPVFYAGTANYEPANHHLTGMGRGYQYIFAYTVKYSPTGTGAGTMIYPFDTSDYEDYKNATEYKVYALTSEIQKAPKCNPQFFTYPLNNTKNGGKTLSLKYYYTDGDNTINSDETSSEHTQIRLGDNTQSAGGIGPKNQWNQIDLSDPNGSKIGTFTLSPWLDYKIYELDYTHPTDGLPDVFDPVPTFFMGHYPMEIVDQKVLDAMKEIQVELDDTQIDRNQLILRLKGDTMAGDLYEQAVKRIAALKVTFTKNTGGGTGREVIKYLYVDPSAQRATLSTSELGELVGTDPISATYEVIYDTGYQGWDLLTEAAEKEGKYSEVAIQKLEKTTEQISGESVASYKLGNYLIKNPNAETVYNSPYPANSIFQHDVDQKLPEKFSKDRIIMTFGAPTNPSKPYSFSRWYTFSHNGLSQGNYDPVNQKYPEDYEVPKQLKTAHLDDKDEFNLSQVTPTVTIGTGNLNVGVQEVSVNSFAVNGFEPIIEDGYQPQLRLEVYKVASGQPYGDMVSSSEIINVKKGDTAYYNKKIGGLEIDMNYCLVVKYRKSESDTEWTPLMSSVNPQYTNITLFTTKSSITVTIPQKNYVINNNGYFDKSLRFDYVISQSYSIHIEYELWDEKGSTCIADADELEKLGMIKKYPEDQGYSPNMDATMKIGNGTKLLPGKKYMIKIKVYGRNQNGLTDSPMGEGSFIVDRESNVSPSVYFEAASATNRLDFYLTVSDASNVLMGRKFGTSESTTGIFKVRFFEVTATGDKPLKTDYDDKLFYAGDGRQTFTLKNLAQESEYKMNVYAVRDMDENGTNDNGPAGELEKHEWNYYYQGQTSTDGSSAPTCDIAEGEGYLVGSRIQRTLDEQGIYLGSDQYLDTPPNRPSVLRLMLTEATGLDQITELEYTITGNKGFNHSGTAQKPDSSTSIFTTVPAQNYSYFEFPPRLSDGAENYTVELRFKINGQIYATRSLKYNKTQ